MGQISISGDTSGTTTLNSPAIAGTTIITFPNAATGVTASTTNTVTTKIALVINGTTYYLLASTSGT
jgi:hypothetical protein